MISLYKTDFDSFVWFSHSGSQKSSSGAAPGLPIYVDLAYIPNHCSAKNVDQEFFKRIRSAYYVVSGNDTANGEPSRGVLDALLDGKSQWGSNLQVTFPTVFSLRLRLTDSVFFQMISCHTEKGLKTVFGICI